MDRPAPAGYAGRLDATYEGLALMFPPAHDGASQEIKEMEPDEPTEEWTAKGDVPRTRGSKVWNRFETCLGKCLGQCRDTVQEFKSWQELHPRRQSDLVQTPDHRLQGCGCQAGASRREPGHAMQGAQLASRSGYRSPGSRRCSSSVARQAQHAVAVVFLLEL